MPPPPQRQGRVGLLRAEAAVHFPQHDPQLVLESGAAAQHPSGRFMATLILEASQTFGRINYVPLGPGTCLHDPLGGPGASFNSKSASRCFIPSSSNEPYRRSYAIRQEGEDMTGATLVEIMCNLIDRFRPHRSLGNYEVFQFRLLVGGALLGLVVSILAISVTISTGIWPATLSISLFGVGLLGLILATRGGVSLSILGWYCLILIGIFLLFESLIPAELQHNQLSWLAILPMCSLILQPIRGASDNPTTNPRMIWGAAIMAMVIGAFIVTAHRFGWTMGWPSQNYGPFKSDFPILIDHGLFISSMTGMLWIYHLALKKAEDESQLLRQLLSVCAWCKQIKDKEEGWITMERHLS